MSIIEIRHPEVEVKLTETDGNAFVIIGAVRRAMRRADVSNEELDEFSKDAMSGDYDHVLQTCMKWVNVT